MKRRVLSDISLTELRNPKPDVRDLVRQRSMSSADQESDDESIFGPTKRIKTDEDKENIPQTRSRPPELQSSLSADSRLKTSQSVENEELGKKLAKRVNIVERRAESVDFDPKSAKNVSSGQSLDDSIAKWLLADDTIQEFKERLVPTLEVLILKGCFRNIKHKSALIREISKYCPKRYDSMEMFIKNLSLFDLLEPIDTIDLISRHCLNLQCLRLSYCKVSADRMKSLQRLPVLRCLHLEYIYGISSAAEWEQVAEVLSPRLSSLSFSATDMPAIDLSGMVSKLEFLNRLTLEDYMVDPIKLFSSLNPQIFKISLNNYHDIDDKAIRALAKRLPKYLTELELTFDSFHTNRSNTNLLFPSVCERLPRLRVLTYKLITMTNLSPLFKLRKLVELNLQFSVQKWIDFPGVYLLENLRSLSLTKVLFTPSRVYSMVRAFPRLTALSLTGSPPKGKDHIDCPLFCCECRKRNTENDNCLLCYQNCCSALIELSDLKVLKFNFVRVRSSLATIVPYIPAIKHLVVNPFDCRCGHLLVRSAVKIAELRRFTLEIRKAFINAELNRTEVFPEKLTILDFDPSK